MKTYTYTCYDSEEGTTTTIELNTENDCWHGYNGPVYAFFKFLRGCGFVFGVNDELGVMKHGGADFVSCVNDYE